MAGPLACSQSDRYVFTKTGTFTFRIQTLAMGNKSNAHIHLYRPDNSEASDQAEQRWFRKSEPTKFFDRNGRSSEVWQVVVGAGFYVRVFQTENPGSTGLADNGNCTSPETSVATFGSTGNFKLALSVSEG